ncbi:T9SS type A sorting domain-containing protein [Aureispira sp. CCB-E]|uniref:T9SS type A sorting domain-containing protein n=1 Tax=Aureispira sp. CCB-E TaxID=3051121 RepID=UPI0028696F6E|nr:T9SS type A sorting domain-containing protein [Aureispira sp. CCB-E]WMX12682.1 T9SS type A sorting domain-containing protein [Aureispira sp. CCB-E]
MTKNLSLKIQYAIFACLLWFGLIRSSQAQMLTLDYDVDSNCIVTINLLDSNNIVASFNPPYHFSLGGINVSSNSLGSVSIDASQLAANSFYSIEVIDGNLNYYYDSINLICGQTFNGPSILLTDSLLQSPTTCTQCNGSGQISILNPNGSPYTFQWSDGITATDTLQHTRNNLCPGIYTIVVTDNAGNRSATSLTVTCNSPTTPQVATCFNSITRYLDANNQVSITPNDLSLIGIDTNKTQAYLIDPSGAITTSQYFDCNNLGYHYFTLLLIDSIQQIPDTCTVLVNIQDTLNACNGLIGNTNEVIGNTTNSSNCATCDGSYTFIQFMDSTTATGPATFAWSDGSTAGPIRTDLCPEQNYVLSVSDVNGVIHTAIVSTGCFNGACIDSNLIDSALSCPAVYAPVCGCDSLTYINACVATHKYGIASWTQGPCGGTNSLSLIVSTTPDASCDTIIGCSGTVNISVLGGLPPYNITWSDTTISGFSPTNMCPGNYTVVVSDLFGYSVASIVTVGVSGCVWPGDTDDNTVANNFDLLPIGLAYGDAGPPRAITSNTWTPYAASDWSTTPIIDLPNGKHFDSNGDGVVDSLDINAIQLNYGRSYFRSGGHSLAGISPFGINNAIANTGDSLATDIYLGSTFYPITDAYGLAFTINYNPDHIEAGSVMVDFSNSWLGNDLIHIQKVFHRVGQIEVAVSRKDKYPISGQGPIGAMHFTIKDDLIMGKWSSDTIISPVTISSVRLINHQNLEIGTTPITGHITISGLLDIPPTPDNLDIRLFPNPTDGLLNIISEKSEITSIKVFNAMGQLIDSNNSPDPYTNKISMERLASGVYFLSIQTNNGIYNQKVKVIH